MIACGIAKNHYTPKGMEESKTFSVNIPSSDLLEKTDYCGLVSGAKTDKSEVFTVFYGSLETAPMIKECPVCLECRLARTVTLPTHYLYIGEIVGAYADERVIQDGNPDFSAIDPLFLTMPDNRYWMLGNYAGDAWSAGKEPGASIAQNHTKAKGTVTVWQLFLSIRISAPGAGSALWSARCRLSTRQMRTPCPGCRMQKPACASGAGTARSPARRRRSS